MLKRKKEQFDENIYDGYVRLGNEVVKLAVRDYRKNLAIISKHPFDEKAKDEVERIERFFHSRLYGIITTVDPDMVIRKIRGEFRL